MYAIFFYKAYTLIFIQIHEYFKHYTIHIFIKLIFTYLIIYSEENDREISPCYMQMFIIFMSLFILKNYGFIMVLFLAVIE